MNYFNIETSLKNLISIRNDFLNDPQGQRTGFATAYTKGVTPYDNGTKKDQYTASMDLIVRF